MSETKVPEDPRTSLLRSLARQQRGTRSALDWLQAVLWRIPGRPVDVNKLLLLRFEGTPCPSDRLLRGAAIARAGVPSDVHGMSRCEGKSIETFLRRFRAGDFCVVAELDGKIIGYSMLRLFGYKIPSFGCCVRTGYGGKGYGSMLTSWTVEKAKAMGYTKVILKVHKNNTIAFQMYKKIGFSITGEIPEKNEIIMEKILFK